MLTVSAPQRASIAQHFSFVAWLASHGPIVRPLLETAREAAAEPTLVGKWTHAKACGDLVVDALADCPLLPPELRGDGALSASESDATEASDAVASHESIDALLGAPNVVALPGFRDAIDHLPEMIALVQALISLLGKLR